MNIVSLPDWESCFAIQVRQVELLGEIPVIQEECEQLGKLLGQYIQTSLKRGRTIQQIRESLQRDYPAAYAVFLVGLGLYGYDEGAYWPGVSQALYGRNDALDPNWTRQLGQLFEDCLDRFQLPQFPDLGGRRYVDLILLHGGIPTYCLDDYFEKMLCPAVTKHWYAGLSPEELIEEWLSRSNIIFIDKPVLRFMEYGGQIAEDFVERTRELAREYAASGLILGADEVGLPERVVEKFGQWADRSACLVKSEEQEDDLALGFRKPLVCLDPIGEGLRLELLPQRVPATFSHSRLEWTITAADQTHQLPVHQHRAGHDWRTTATTFLIDWPAPVYRVELRLDGQPRRDWTFTGPTAEYPLLLFEPETSSLLRWSRSLPAQTLWLVFPTDAELMIEGQAAKIAVFPPLPWGWAGFKCESWDLTQASKLTIRRAGQNILDLPIRLAETPPKPHFVGGDLFTAPSLTTPTPVYIGVPPAIRVPLSGRTSLNEELNRWRLILYSDGPATPNHPRPHSRALSDLRSSLKIENDAVDLPLSLPELLGQTPLGSYIIRLRGPLGRSVELSLRIIPWLDVSGHEKLYLPDPASGPQTIILTVETEAGGQLESQPEAVSCQVEYLREQVGVAKYRVTVAPDQVEARLAVIKTVDGSSVRVPLRVPLRRLRWALVGGAANSIQPVWSGQMLRQSLDAWIQTTAPALLVDPGDFETGLVSDLKEVSLRLIDFAGQELQRHTIAKPRRQGTWRFDLAEFLTTAQQHSAPALRFELEFPAQLDQATQPLQFTFQNPKLTTQGALRLPLLSLSRSIKVENVNLQVLPPTNGYLKLRLTWQEEVHLRNRRVRFWSLWRPWLPHFEQSIPDEASGELEFELPASYLVTQALLGAYLLEFLVVDRWVGPSPAQKPPTDSAGTAIVELISPRERLKQIERLLKPSESPKPKAPSGLGRLVDALVGRKEPSPEPDLAPLDRSERLALILERAYIQAYLGDQQQAKADMNACFDYLAEANFSQILALVTLAQQSSDQRLLTVLQLKIFAPKILQRLLQQQESGEITSDQFQAYISHLPRSALLPLESCHLLLTLTDDRLKVYAILQLIQRGEVQGVSATVDLIQNRTLSDADAAGMLKLNLNLAIPYLEKNLDHPAAVRLLELISPDRSAIIRPDHWVRCHAGWGRITRIEKLENNQPLNYLIRGQSGLRLHLILRPQQDAEPVIVEILKDRHRVRFIKPHPKLYRCTKADNRCNFITPNQHLLESQHNRVAHGGIGPAFAIEHKREFLSVKPPEYSVRAPRDILV